MNKTNQVLEKKKSYNRMHQKQELRKTTDY